MIADDRPLWIKPGLERSLLIGVLSIDREHLDLVSQLDSLSTDLHARPDGEAFSRVLGRLGGQIGAHFANEEEVLQSIGMPADDISQHVLAHDEILEDYARLNFDLMEGKVPGRAAVLASIRGWIIDHIQTHDIKIRKYLPKD
jgi:hemerythrin